MNWLKKACEQEPLKQEQPEGAEDKWIDIWLTSDTQPMKKKADFADEHGIPDGVMPAKQQPEAPAKDLVGKVYNVLEEGFLVMIPYSDLDISLIEALKNSTAIPTDVHADADKHVIVMHTTPEDIPSIEEVLKVKGFTKA